MPVPAAQSIEELPLLLVPGLCVPSRCQRMEWMLGTALYNLSGAGKMSTGRSSRVWAEIWVKMDVLHTRCSGCVWLWCAGYCVPWCVRFYMHWPYMLWYSAYWRWLYTGADLAQFDTIYIQVKTTGGFILFIVYIVSHFSNYILVVHLECQLCGLCCPYHHSSRVTLCDW